jgi:dihydrofolate reductase
MAVALSRRYATAYDGLWLNLYRDGRDSTGWHRDRFRPESLTWQKSRGLGNDVVGTLRELKKQDGPTLLTQRSGKLVHLLLSHDLVDELRLLTYPLVLGRGKRFFGIDAAPAAFQLVTSKVSPNGAVPARSRWSSRDRAPQKPEVDR